MFDNSPMKMQATKAFVIMSILFAVFTIGTGFVIAADKGYGAGPWDSHTVWSCYGPGGHAYYLKGVPRAKQPCPNPWDTSLNSHGRVTADSPSGKLAQATMRSLR
jgi:hypothetical protein